MTIPASGRHRRPEHAAIRASGGLQTARAVSRTWTPGKHRSPHAKSRCAQRRTVRRPDKKMTRPERRHRRSRGRVTRTKPKRPGRGSRTETLHHVLIGRLNHLPAPIVAAVLAGPMHHLRIPAIVALHELRGLQLVVVRRATLSGAGFRMSSLRYSHNLVPFT